MPSYVTHLACAKKFLEYCPDFPKKYMTELFVGNIVADMVEDKKSSHFWDDFTYQKLERKPNLSDFMGQYKDKLKSPYVFGYYMHLYLDFVFLEQYWDKHFRFYDAMHCPETNYDAVHYVQVVEQNREYLRSEFFSKAYYYGDYDRMNPYLVRRYNLCISDMNLITDKIKYLSDIQEIDWDISFPILEKTLSFLEQSIRENKKEFKKPPLNIFLLSELESMIDSVAKEMARCYA